MNSISPIFKYIRSYYSAGFKLWYLLAILLMLSTVIWFNYFHTPISALSSKSPWILHFAASYLLYFIPFALAFRLQYFFYRHTSYLKNKFLLLLIIAAPAIFALRVNFNFHHFFIEKYFNGDEIKFWIRCSDWIIRALFILIVIYFISTYFRNTSYYSPTGLTKAKTYLLLIACMIPLIALAAFQPSFMHMYPRAQMIGQLHLSNKAFHYVSFELSYAFDFISIETFFRGFLIFSFMRICGMKCIIPAACFYCCIHLGKPMGEAISSFWGGLLLGIISYHTKNIWGGILIHIGIAALMEIAGFAAHLL